MNALRKFSNYSTNRAEKQYQVSPQNFWLLLKPIDNDSQIRYHTCSRGNSQICKANNVI